MGLSHRRVIAGSTHVLAVRPRAEPLREAGPQAWMDDLSELRAVGFEAIDLVDSWLSPADLSPGELAALAEAIDANGLRLAGLSVIRRSIIDPELGEENLALTLRALEAAPALGAPIVSIGFHRPLTAAQRASQFWMVDAPGDDRSESTWGLATQRLRIVVRRAEELGLRVALEMHEGTLLDSSAGVLRILDAVASDVLGVNPDLGNLVRVPRPLDEGWEETLRAVLPHTTYWHVKNYLRLEHPSAGIYLSAPSELAGGCIDYRRAFRLAFDAGYEGPLCIEHYEGDALGAIARGRSYVGELLRDLSPAAMTP
jgi:sugar phosphate isomerase/epimerase